MNYNFSDRLKNLGGNTIREIFKLLQDPDMISFAGGFPTKSLLPVELIKEISDEILMSPEAYDVLQYGGTEGYMPFRKTAIDFVKRYSINNIDIDNILIVSGGQQTIDLSCKAFLNKGDVVLVEDPTYLAVLHILKTYEAKAIGLKSGDEGIDLTDLENKIKEYHPKMVYLVPTFSNPTGRTIGIEKRMKIAELTAKYEVMLVEDDPYSELRYEGERVPSIKSFDTTGNIIFTTSFSKTIAPGLRCAICVGAKEVIRKLTIGKQATDVHTSSLSQAIINRYLLKGYMDPQLKKVIPLYRQKKDAMIEAIKKYMPKELKYTNPEGGLFIWGTFDCNIDTAKIFADVCTKTKTAYVAGYSFFADENTKNCLRLNFSNASLEEIDKGMKRLGNYLKSVIAEVK